MRDRDYYPAGAYDDPNAPYNQVDPPEKEFELTVSQTLSKSVTITTDKYIPEGDYETGRVYANTSETDWYEIYEEAYPKIQELLAELKQYAIKDLENTCNNTSKRVHLNTIIEACDGWIEDEYEIVEN